MDTYGYWVTVMRVAGGRLVNIRGHLSLGEASRLAHDLYHEVGLAAVGVYSGTDRADSTLVWSASKPGAFGPARMKQIRSEEVH